MIGLIFGMIACAVFIFLSANAWMGEIVGAAIEDDEPHPLTAGAIFITGAAILFYIWLAIRLLGL